MFIRVYRVAISNSSVEWYVSLWRKYYKHVQASLVPRPPHSFCRLQYKKRGEPGNEATFRLVSRIYILQWVLCVYVLTCTHMHSCCIQPFTLGSQTLSLPKLTKQFLISPPASPPVGWEPSDEQAPCLDFSLVTALASLQLPGRQLHGD